METATAKYISNRFQDYYRQVEMELPPMADSREWGFIPWEKNTMIRHISLLNYESLRDLLITESPQHVYFSAAHYMAPSSDTMENKGWKGTDLVFDIDADHLSTVNENRDDYSTMLSECKNALYDLLDFLRDDFGYREENMEIVFSGRRGYHVHIRNPRVRQLNSKARQQIVDYITGEGVDFASVTSGGSAKQMIPSGWGERVRKYIVSEMHGMQSLSENEALERLRTIDQVGEKRANKIYTDIQNREDAIQKGRADVSSAFKLFVQHAVEETVKAESVGIDEPVTTDLHRLIRVPGSLHGGSGLKVVRIQPDELEQFNPLVDAVPEIYGDYTITVEVTEPTTVRLNGKEKSVDPGTREISEDIAIFLMTTRRAEKV